MWGFSGRVIWGRTDYMLLCGVFYDLGSRGSSLVSFNSAAVQVLASYHA